MSGNHLHPTERVGVAVKLYTHIKGVLGSNLDQETGYLHLVFFGPFMSVKYVD
jgi:hypothetical protein